MFWKKNFLQPSVHKGYIAVELLMAIVVLGMAFSLFWKIYYQRRGNDVFDEKYIYQAQYLMQNAISSNSNGSDFSLVSKNGHIYRGFLLQTSVENVSYKYFSPTMLQK